MSLETEVIAKYGPLFGNRIWWRVVPESVGRDQLSVPFCVVTHAGGRSRVYADNTMSDERNARLEFTVWGDHVIAVMDKARELRQAVLDSDADDWIVMLYGEAVSDYDDVLKLHGARQDFGIWHLVSPP